MEKCFDIAAEIDRLKTRLGADLCIAGHHYQQQAVIDHCDIIGDSLELARKVKNVTAKHIVFCGVYFMGESSALLAAPGQNIYLPAPEAECVMAKGAPAKLVATVLEHLNSLNRKIIPIAYVNSSLAVKAVVGRFGGAVCTSANAEKMARWGMEQGDALMFLPDKNLGQNVGHLLGIPSSEMHVLDIRGQGSRLDMEAAGRARMLLWPSGCAVHGMIHTSHVEAARTATGVHVVAHPECAPEVIDACDESGSTTTLIRAVREAQPGSIVYVGTEANLVDRLRAEVSPRGVDVRPLRRCVCSNMAKITPERLRDVLQGIVQETAVPVRISDEEATYARMALNRMLDVCK